MRIEMEIQAQKKTKSALDKAAEVAAAATKKK